MCAIIHTFEHIETDTKVRMLFVLSVPVNGDFLQELHNNAHVVVDGNNRITHYKSESLELKGYHMLPTAKNYWTTDPEYIDLLNYLIEETENVESPMNLLQLARGFKEMSGAAQTVNGLNSRILKVRTKIHSFEHLDKNTKVKLIFALSAPVDAYFLKDKNNADAVSKNKREGEMWNLIEYITEKCENVNSPLNITRMAKDYNNHFGISEAIYCIRHRIRGYLREIQTSKYLNTPTKVRQLFGLSATVDSDYLEKLREKALVEVDDKKRITHYKANDGSLELRGDHSRSAKSKRSHRSLIRDYFENKNDSDVVPKTERQKEIGHLIDFIIEKCEQVISPLSIHQVAKDFNKHVGFSQSIDCIHGRIRGYCREIQETEFLDAHTKVKHLFSLSAKVTSDCLEKLRKAAHVEVDNKNRVFYYKANDGSLELRGDHSKSAKQRAAKLESKQSHRWLIRNYFENESASDAVPKTELHKEIGNLIKFITEKCEHVNSPLSIHQLAKDFNKHVGLSQSLDLIHGRIRGYCREIQRTEFLDIQTKSKQLFCLSMKLDSDCLKELRKIAVVEVDHENRIIKYTSNDGSLSLQGSHGRSKKALSRCVEKTDKDNTAAMSDYSEEESDHEGLDDSSSSAKDKSGRIVRRKSKKSVKKHSIPDSDKSEESEIEDGYSEEDSDEYSSEEFGSEFDSDNETDSMNEPEDLVGRSNEASNFFSASSMRNRSSSGMSIEDKFGFDRSEETGNREDKENDTEKTENAVIKTRSGRLSKKRHLDSEFSYDLANFGSSEATMNTHSASSKPAKQKKIAVEKEEAASSSNQSRNSALLSISTGENRDDQDAPDYSIDDQVKLEPFRGSIQEDLKGIVDDKDIQQIPKPMETPIKVEVEEPVEVKPETSHNSKTQLFEAMQSLILCLDTTSLSEIQSKIHQKIQMLEKHDEVMLNKKISLIIDSLISRVGNHSVVNLSKTAESVNLSNFLCYLKSAILNSKMIGVEGFVQNISKLIEESQNKRVPMEKVANALRASLDIDGF